MGLSPHLALRPDGPVGYQIYVADHFYDEWRFYNAAYDESGQALSVTPISQKVDSCGQYSYLYTEHIGVNISRGYLAAHQASGIRFQISGKSGKEVFFVPPSYIQTFPAAVPDSSSPVTATSAPTSAAVAATAPTATESQIDAEYEAVRKQDTVKAYQEFLYRYHANDKHYAEALARLDQLLHLDAEHTKNWLIRLPAHKVGLPPSHSQTSSRS